jgi:hypothetical protein
VARNPWDNAASLVPALGQAALPRRPSGQGSTYLTGPDGKPHPITDAEWKSGYLVDQMLGQPRGTYQAQQTGQPLPAPYQPPIPAGYYDPSLDAQRDAASRGLLNTEQDVGLAGRRAQEDLGFETGQINTGYQRGIQDTELDRSYVNADFTQQHDWNQADYERNVGMLTRSTQQLGRQQAEQARKYGVTSGGIALLSAAKRAENESLERQGIDTGYQRAQSTLTTGHDRALAGLDTSQRRLGEDRSSQLGRAGSLYDRGVADRGTALSRARGEDLFYGLDVDALKRYQAKQAGWGA